MTSESKILTVSYGTFSCTLEGFENPFDTMKAIAEYFRDLAAQDRHFGAEPPPPDAAMLHRLAEREVSRLATGRTEDTARAAPAGTFADSPVAPAVTPRIQFNPVNRRSAVPVADSQEAAAPEVATPEPSLQDVIPDGVAAKLARIRRSVHPTVAEATPVADFAADPEITAPADLAAEELVLDRQADAAAVEDDEPVAAIAVEIDATSDSVADSILAEASEAVAARLGELIATDPAGYDEEDADTFAASVWEDPVEALDAAPAIDEADAAAFVVLDDVEIASDTLVAEAELSDATDAEDLALLAELDGIALEEAGVAAAFTDELPEDQPQDYLLSDVAVQDPLPELTEDTATETVEDAQVEAVATEPTPEATEDVMAEVAEAPAPVVEEPTPMTGKSGRGRRNSRIIRLHPDATSDEDYDFGATRVLAAGEESDEVSRLMQQAEEVMAEDANRRRQEALSRLKAAVVATEADRADIDYEAPKAEANLDPYRGDLAEAIQPDLTPEPQPEADVKPRRKSVTIRPAADPRPGTIRPGMISPSPLVLVSEQRIDRVAVPAPTPTPAPAPSFSPATPGITPSLPAGQPMVALRTGRLSGAIGAGAAHAASGMAARNIVLEKPSYGPATEADDDEDLAEDSHDINEAGFASFAELVGARSMAEMLEAAAAYATCVENRSQFTRPQLMRRMMASAGGKSVSREDGLRSFGTLLRTGRIEKITRGHYSLAENSPYLAEARRLN